MGNPLCNVAFLQFGQVETGREILTFACEQHGADAVRQRGEELLDADDRLVIKCVALVWAVEPQNGNRLLPLGNERGREPDRKPLCHHSTS